MYNTAKIAVMQPNLRNLVKQTMPVPFAPNVQRKTIMWHIRFQPELELQDGLGALVAQRRHALQN